MSRGLCTALVAFSGSLGIGLLGDGQIVFAQKANAPAAAAAAELNLAETGLGLAPSDAAFFQSSLNMRKGWKEIEEGWLAEVRQVPYVQQLETYLREQWDKPEAQTAQAKAFFNSPIAQDLLSLIVDMSAQEFFIYGEHDWAEFLNGMAELQAQIAQINGEDQEAVREFVLQLEKAEMDAIPLPTTIIGFQLSDDENARTQLDALQGVLQLALGSSEELKPIAEGLRRKDIENGQILSFTLEADDIPWQNLPRGEEENMGEVIDHLAELFEGRKAVISLAVIDNRLMFAVSDNSDTLLQMGKEENLLTADAFKQLTDHQPADLRGVSYASAEMRTAAWNTNFGNYFERLAQQISNAMMAEAEDPEALQEWQEKLVTDCQWLDERIAELMPEYAPVLGYSFVTPQGSESLTYDWTPSVLLENAKPLAVARHGGTTPLILLAQRHRQLDEVTEIIDAVMDEIPAHADAIFESGIVSEEDAEKAQEIFEGIWPIVEDMYAAVRDKIMPSLDGNECLVAVTALATVNELSEDAPPPPEPLPMPEVGVVLKLKSQEDFLSGCEGFVTALNDMLDFIREQDPDALPSEVRIPPPNEESLPGGGTRYSYPSGAPAPFDQFQLQLAIYEQIAVAGYSTRQVRDMFQSRPLASRPAWYNDREPTAVVGFVDCAGIFKAIKPWVHYALTTSGKELSEPLAPATGEAPIPTGSDILQIWDTFDRFGKAAGTTVIDQDDVTVSHWIWVAQ